MELKRQPAPLPEVKKLPVPQPAPLLSAGELPSITTETKPPTLRERILIQKKRSREPLGLPDWPEGIYILELTAGEIERYDDKLNDDPDVVANPKLKKQTWLTRMAYWVAIALVDESGSHIWNPDDEKDIHEIMDTISYHDLRKVEQRVLGYNHLREADKTIVKND